MFSDLGAQLMNHLYALNIRNQLLESTLKIAAVSNRQFTGLGHNYLHPLLELPRLPALPFLLLWARAIFRQRLH